MPMPIKATYQALNKPVNTQTQIVTGNIDLLLTTWNELVTYICQTYALLRETGTLTRVGQCHMKQTGTYRNSHIC